MFAPASLSRRTIRAPFGPEPLESRRLLAGYALAEYFPTKAGYTWNYVGTQGGQATTVARTVVADTTAGATLRIDDAASAVGVTASTHTYYRLDADGLWMVRQDNSADVAGDTRITFGQPLKVLSASMRKDQVISWNNVPVSAVVHSQDFGTVSGSGTDTGSARVFGVARVDLPDGTYIPAALKVVIDHTETYTGRVGGQTGTVTAHLIETAFLAPGIGMVKSSARVSGTIKLGGETENVSISSDFLIDSSPLLPSFQTQQLGDGTLKVTGTAGRDTLRVIASSGKVRVSNGARASDLTPPFARIEVYAKDGNDQVTVDYGAVPTYVDAGIGNDLVYTGLGKDTLTGGAGKDTLYAGDGDDRVNGNGTNDQLFGQAGADRIYGGDHNDLLDGGGGVDRLWGDAGNDTIVGGGSNDKLDGGAGDDSILGGAGNDLLTCGGGRDSLFGNDGDDTLYAHDSAADLLDGGAGNDACQKDAGESGVVGIEQILP